MTVRLVVLASVALLLGLVPVGSAEQPALPLPSPAAGACLAAADAPPCGYIVPQISLDFPNKPTCRAKTLGGPIELGECLPLPPVGGSHTEDGVMRFTWDITQDGTYPLDPACLTGAPQGCIVVSFSGTASNAKWMSVAIEPKEVVIDNLVMAQNNVVDPETQQVTFLLEVPLTVTFTRTGEGADEASLKKLDRAQGAVQMFVKAKSSASGQYFKEAFGVEEFRFNACANDDALQANVARCAELAGTASNGAPGLAPLAALGALMAVGAVLRRRA